ncbi:DUF4870 domain-containing protein [Staphylococcus sp. NRL 16/872]|uniref:DUF4870 domain-containing protein n=1 Tax=Staphylococcus sp. NRL 16/872 TaxID=2930131 RepID=UPI001FB46BB6|nr:MULTISPECIES: DUF4870 domain-containing protein [unclassified Staphylococcus]MCJ1655762.1 DUF4870 domain-containing protein [Staphylococcus sp. NRL 21/187]MCJ1661577.1 DUF4870 domain-containing protein [Staphylococcus sp. NRL 18/288]MCJ1667493.1 DUF4870 domain-containing protein [Staphylococcus sp. NRL 19/737]WEN69979.1 DUF4870 domain-containing protein [Staphylococcus sp. NRL 16/872]
MTENYAYQANQQNLNNNNDDARLMSMLIFLLGFFTSIIGPIIIWAIKRNEARLIDQAGKNYFNMIISYFIWNVVLGLLFIPIFLGFALNIDSLSIFLGLLVIILALAIFVISILYIIFHIVACVKYFSGNEYVVPLSIRFFK